MTSKTLQFIELVHFEHLTDLDLYNGIDELTGFNPFKVQLLLNEVENFIRKYRELRITRIGHNQLWAEVQRRAEDDKNVPTKQLKSKLHRYYRDRKTTPKKEEPKLEEIDEHNLVFDYERMFFPFDLTNIYTLQGMLIRPYSDSGHEPAKTTFDGYDDGFRHNNNLNYEPIPNESFDWRSSRSSRQIEEINTMQSEDVNDEMFPNKWSIAKRILLINELEMNDFIRSKVKTGLSDNAIAKVLSKLMNANQSSISSLLSGISRENKSDKNNPYKNESNVEMIRAFMIENHFQLK